MIRPTPLAALALASTAGAQSPFTNGSTVSYSLAFVEIGGNANGTLEPGESALIQLSLAFSNQNTTASYTPASPAPGSGTIRGFGSGFIDLIGTANNGGNANGAWNVDFLNPGLGPTRDGWDLLGIHWGDPTNGGSELRNIIFGQFPVSAASIMTTNPIDLMYQALWTPSSYATRTVTFTVAPSLATGGFASSILFKTTGTQTVAGATCASDLGSVSIPIIPTPTAAPLFAAPFLARRRRSEARR